MSKPTVKEIAASVSDAIKVAFMEGVEAGYLLTLEHERDRMQFTYFRDEKATEKWKVSRSKEVANI